MKFVFAVALAAVYGLLIRLFFGSANGWLQIMSVTFLFLVPVFIGFFTIILMPAANTTTGRAAFFKPWLTSLVLLMGTIMLGIEGTICWIMVFPIFAAFAGIGGLLAYHLRKSKNADPNSADTNGWQKPNTLNVSLLFAVPLALGLVEGEKALVPQEMVIQRGVTIKAPTAEVWRALTTSKAVSRHGSHISLSNLLGFPKHVSTRLDAVELGGKRTAYPAGLHETDLVGQGNRKRRTMGRGHEYGSTSGRVSNA